MHCLDDFANSAAAKEPLRRVIESVAAWYVADILRGAPDLRRQSTWAPDGAGFTRVFVIDAKGASDGVMVRGLASWLYPRHKQALPKNQPKSASEI